MLDRKVQMMDAGMVLFETEKPFGTVLGGLKTELGKHGRVLTGNEMKAEELPGSTGECDLFLDWSVATRRRYISCRLEDAGAAGQTANGEPVRRYAVSFKEGDRNRRCRIIAAQVLAAAFFILGIIGIKGIPGIFTIIAGIALAFVTEYVLLSPSKKAQDVITGLLQTAKEAR